MKGNSQLPPGSGVQRPPPAEVSSAVDHASSPLERLLDLAETGEDSAPSLESVSEPGGVARCLELIHKQVALCAEELAAMREELQRLQTVDRVLADMRTHYQELSEQFHEREVLGPVIQGLIGVADRCREQTGKIAEGLKGKKEAGDRHAQKALRYLLSARIADRIEIENALAHLGVEPFKHGGDTFDGQRQKCTRRIKPTNGEPAGRIAARLLPGYKRNGKVVRVEYVDVYVTKHKEPVKQGEPS